ncbi:MAG: methyltransferase domain-containing protein [Betaproteobacteria bacterium]|nr:methyltransferase domain-containing protein [Betaproteobacteria bacterium]
MTEAMAFGRLSQWRNATDFSEATAREKAKQLELRARAEDETATREEYLHLLGLAPGERVLDVGCGSGVVTRAMAGRVAPEGRAVGIDTSPALVAVAREYADAAGFAGSVEFHEGDCRNLPFPDASFDAVIAATVLAHVPDAERALAEMVRVARQGGRVGVFDFDGDAFIIAHPDRVLTRRIVASYSDHATVNVGLTRRLPGLLTALGLVDVRVRGFMPLEREPGSFYAGLAERAAAGAAKMGDITSEEHASWTAALRAEYAAGSFLGGRPHIFAWGTRARS